MNLRRRAILSSIVMVLAGFVVSPWSASLLSGHSQDAALGMLSANAAAVCPLPDDRQRDAAQAWQAMAPVFQSPRCINCHGAVDPFMPESEGKHGGGKINLKMIVDDQSGFGFGTSVVPDWSATFATCQDCHSGLSGWVVPGKPFQFVGKNALSLCQQMKQRNASAQAFVDHIARDSTGIAFIDTGFQGTRGLGPDGILFYEGDTGQKYQPEPIMGITHAQFVQMAQAWVKAMGGQFVGDASCGCQPPSPKTITGTLSYSMDVAYKVNYNAGDLSITGAAGGHADVTSHWQAVLPPAQTNTRSGVFTATNDIQVNANANLKGAAPSQGNWRHSFALDIGGKGISHNPAQPGDDAYGRPPTLWSGPGQLNNFFWPVPQLPGSIQLMSQNNKNIYLISLGMSQIAPNFNFQTHDEITSGARTYISDDLYDNTNLQHTHTTNFEGARTYPEPRSMLFGGIVPDRRKLNPATGRDAWLNGVYDPQSGVIDGTEEFQSDSCRDTAIFDSLGLGNFVQFNSGLGDKGESFYQDGKGITCSVRYMLKWHLQGLPQ